MSRRNIFIAGVVILFLIILAALILFIKPVQLQLPEGKNKVLVLTFDTEYPYGVSEEDVSESDWLATIASLIEIADKYNISFQFNVLGRTAEDYPKLIKELADAGQAISCHSYSHTDQTTINYSEKLREIRKCKEIVGNVTEQNIQGNRFPYTKWDDDSFRALIEVGYVWDSSVWAHQIGAQAPIRYKGIIEFPIASTHSDDGYFIYSNYTDSKIFYENFERDLDNLDKGEVYIIVLHPWILSIDESRIQELDSFLERVKTDYPDIWITDLDKLYQKIQP